MIYMNDEYYNTMCPSIPRLTNDQKKIIESERICGTKLIDIMREYDFNDSYYIPNVIFQYIKALINFDKTLKCADTIVFDAFETIRNELLIKTTLNHI